MEPTSKRVFIHGSETWYWPSSKSRYVDEVNIVQRCYDKDGHAEGCEYEFVAVWVDLGSGSGRPDPTLRIDIFAESFAAYTEFADLFAVLNKLKPDKQNLSPDEFCKLLITLGIEDVTERQRPHDVPAPPSVCPTCHQSLPSGETP